MEDTCFFLIHSFHFSLEQGGGLLWTGGLWAYRGPPLGLCVGDYYSRRYRSYSSREGLVGSFTCREDENLPHGASFLHLCPTDGIL